MADNKGTDSFDSLEGSSSWFITEAQCINELDSLETIFDGSTSGSCISNLIDDLDECEQGNSLSLFNEQITEACDKAVFALKRKLLRSPQQSDAVELSPRLAAVSISPKRLSKRRLFDDSGIVDDEAANSIEKVAVDSLESDSVAVTPLRNSNNVAASGCGRELEILQNSNGRAFILAKFKENFGVSFTELVRTFKSDKSCSVHWVVTVVNAAEEVVEASKILLQQDCSYVQLVTNGFHALYLLQFKAMKSRETVCKLMCKLLNAIDKQMLIDPPKCRSTVGALYFYRRTFGNSCYTFGTLPEWIAKLVLVEHQQSSAPETFQLSDMVQWAYDNHLTTEAEIAYGYAALGRKEPNAAAFLKSNNQVKYVRDCCTMVRLYRRQEMREMSMGEWINKCCEECEEDGDWKVLAQFLRYQNVNFMSFVLALKTFLKGVPKKSCMLFYGPPDTGKSLFCSSLNSFLRGRVASYMNRSSQFWLQPLIDGKIGFIDDITYQGWLYMDTNMRNALDGNDISIDTKHKAPQQTRLPPLLLTSNVDVHKEETLKYLHSRIVAFEFPNKLPYDSNDNLIYNINNATWKCFFSKLAVHLDLNPPDEDESGRPDRTLRCTAGSPIDSN